MMERLNFFISIAVYYNPQSWLFLDLNQEIIDAIQTLYLLNIYDSESLFQRLNLITR